MGSVRISRTKRRTRRSLRPTKRDLGVLHALGRMKLLSTRQLMALFSWSRSTINKRMRRLYDAGLVSCFAPQLGGENSYGLSRNGRDALIEAGHESEDMRYQVMTRLGRTNLKHLGLINDFWILLATKGLEDGRKLARFYPEWEIRPASTSGLCPDAIFALRNSEGRVTHDALEADLGTEARSVLQSKIKRYRAVLTVRQHICGLPVQGAVFASTNSAQSRRISRIIDDLDASAYARAVNLEQCEG